MKHQLLNIIRKYPKIPMAVIAFMVVVIGYGVFSINIGNDTAPTIVEQETEIDLGQKLDSIITKSTEEPSVYGEDLAAYYSNVPEEVEKLYELRVGDDIQMTFTSIEDMELALRIVQQEALGTDYETQAKVVLKKDGFQVESTAKKIFSLRGVLTNHSLSTSSATDGESEVLDDETIEELLIEAEDQEAVLHFYEDVVITAVEETDLPVVSAIEGAAILNKTNQQPAQYEVQSGDSPYSIAGKHDMSLNQLYKINEGLEEKAKGLKVGDMVTVEVLQPELSVIVEEEVSYFDVVERGVDYQDDDTIYKTVEKEADPGYDGTKEVTAIIQTMNGEEIGREILTETVVSEPKNALVLVGTKALPEVGPVGKFVPPMRYYIITSPFGNRWGSFHRGVDLAHDYGATIYASDGGTVIVSGWSGGYGYMVEIDHGEGRVSRYAHCSKLLVSEGQEVGQGQPIAKLGNSGNSTGPHLHFEIVIDKEPQNPLDYIYD